MKDTPPRWQLQHVVMYIAEALIRFDNRASYTGKAC